MESAIALLKEFIPQPETILAWAALIVAGFVIATLADRLTAWTLRHEFDDDEAEGDIPEAATQQGDAPDSAAGELDLDSSEIHNP